MIIALRLYLAACEHASSVAGEVGEQWLRCAHAYVEREGYDLEARELAEFWLEIDFE